MANRPRIKPGDILSKTKDPDKGVLALRSTSQVFYKGKMSWSKEEAKKAVKAGRARWVTAQGRRFLIRTKKSK